MGREPIKLRHHPATATAALARFQEGRLLFGIVRGRATGRKRSAAVQRYQVQMVNNHHVLPIPRAYLYSAQQSPLRAERAPPGPFDAY
jgi:hypothetical protein